MSQKQETNKSDGKYTIRDIAKAVGIMLLWMHFILKGILKAYYRIYWKMTKNGIRVQTAKELLKMFQS